MFVPAVVAMHAGIGLTMHLDYSAMAATVLVVFVDWPALADRLRGPARTRRPVRPCPRRGATMTTEADLLILGAPVWTGDPARPGPTPWPYAAAGLAAAGPEREVAALRGPATGCWPWDGRRPCPGPPMLMSTPPPGRPGSWPSVPPSRG